MEGGRSLKLEQLFVGFKCRKFWSMPGALVEKELRMADDINKNHCNLGAPFDLLPLSLSLSLYLSTGVNNHL